MANNLDRAELDIRYVAGYSQGVPRQHRKDRKNNS